MKWASSASSRASDFTAVRRRWSASNAEHASESAATWQPLEKFGEMRSPRLAAGCVHLFESGLATVARSEWSDFRASDTLHSRQTGLRVHSLSLGTAARRPARLPQPDKNGVATAAAAIFEEEEEEKKPRFTFFQFPSRRDNRPLNTHREAA